MMKMAIMVHFIAYRTNTITLWYININCDIRFHIIEVNYIVQYRFAN